jgi:hypothetical protein
VRRTTFDHEPDGLKRRLHDLERQVADLQRVRDAPPQYVEAAEGGGGITEAFVADSVGTAATNIAAGGWSGSIQFRTQGAASNGRFRTAGISDMSSAVTSVTMPAGLWQLTAMVSLLKNTTAPSSGYVDVAFTYENEYHRVPWSQIADPGSGYEFATAWLHRTYYFSSAAAMGFSIFNETNQALWAACKVFSGARLAEYGDLTLA